MSPLVAAPNRGYADWQRVDNWDTGVLFTHTDGTPIDSDASPILDVSRTAYLCGLDEVAANDVSVLIVWYADGDGLAEVGRRTFTLSQFIAGHVQYHLPNLGPFVVLQWGKIGAAQFVHDCHIFGTNRVHPLEFIPGNPVLIDRQGVALGSSATAIAYPAGYYAGPVAVWLNIANSNAFVNLQCLTAAGTWDDLDQRAVALVNDTYTMVTPPGAWRIQVVNNTAIATVYYLAVTPTTTGAT